MKKLRLYPGWSDVFVLLLPLFFLLHEWNARFAMLNYEDISGLAVHFFIVIIIIHILTRLLIPKATLAFCVTMLVGILYFFFGNFCDALHLSAIKPVLIFLFALIIFLYFIYRLLSKKDSAATWLVRFYLLLMIVYLAIEIGSLTIKIINDRPVKTAKVDVARKPDVYLLVFDEYASSQALLKYFNYDNHRFDSFMLKNDFIEVQESKSNYNFTVFSMAATLNYAYIDGIDRENIGDKDYLKAFGLIRNSAVQSFFETNGYQVRNYSYFNLGQHHHRSDIDIIAFGKGAIRYQTLEGRLSFLLRERFGKKEWQRDDYLDPFIEMQKNVNGVQREAGDTSRSPRFVYLHVLAPHPPSYADSTGVPLCSETAYKRSLAKDPATYTAYLHYWNLQIENLVMHIISSTKDKAVIIVMGDHGFRKYDLHSFANEHHFMNMMAVHFPADIKPTGAVPATLVNLFPFVLNNVFKTNIPYKTDSSFFLKIKGKVAEDKKAI